MAVNGLKDYELSNAVAANMLVVGYSYQDYTCSRSCFSVLYL